jgi:predicted metal-dependent HD superfamily phosphohydrolase
MDVVDTVNEIAENMKVNNEEKEQLLIAAWFHDTGYIKSVDDHERLSGEIAEIYLKERHYSLSNIYTIKRLILSTKIPQNPKNKLEMVLCDADLAYMGSDILTEKIELLREEWKMTLNKSFSDYEWLNQNINFIESNSFHTDYAKEKFGKILKSNLGKLKLKAAELAVLN